MLTAIAKWQQALTQHTDLDHSTVTRYIGDAQRFVTWFESIKKSGYHAQHLLQVHPRRIKRCRRRPTMSGDPVAPVLRRDPRLFDALGVDAPYHSSDDSSPQARDIFYAVDRPTGQERWHFRAADYQIGGPVVAGDKVMFTTYAFRSPTSNSHWGHLYVLDLATGRLDWLVELSNEVLSPLVGKGLVFVNDGDKLKAHDLENGAIRWEISITADDSTAAVLSGNTLYLSLGDRLLVVDAATGRQRWQRTLPIGTFMPPTVVDDTLYVGVAATVVWHRHRPEANRYMYVLALDAASGRERWRFPLPDCCQWGATPVVTQERVYFQTSYDLLALDRHTGRGLWRLSKNEGRLFISDILVNGAQTYVVSGDSLLRLPDAATASPSPGMPKAGRAGPDLPPVVLGALGLVLAGVGLRRRKWRRT